VTRTAPLANPTRIVFGGLGWCAVVLAGAGIVVPGLPTTVFVLAASYCFSKSSPRVAQWLRTHPWFGPSLERFVTHGGMPPSAKRHALCAMWTGVLVSSIVLSSAHPMGALATLGLGTLGTLSILFGVRTVPERARARSL
jgi:uncharacterized membrane protein YbaN (DUF454 family)